MDERGIASENARRRRDRPSDAVATTRPLAAAVRASPASGRDLARKGRRAESDGGAVRCSRSCARPGGRRIFQGEGRGPAAGGRRQALARLRCRTSRRPRDVGGRREDRAREAGAAARRPEQDARRGGATRRPAAATSRRRSCRVSRGARGIRTLSPAPCSMSSSPRSGSACSSALRQAGRCLRAGTSVRTASSSAAAGRARDARGDAHVRAVDWLTGGSTGPMPQGCRSCAGARSIVKARGEITAIRRRSWAGCVGATTGSSSARARRRSASTGSSTVDLETSGPPADRSRAPARRLALLELPGVPMPTVGVAAAEGDGEGTRHLQTAAAEMAPGARPGCRARGATSGGSRTAARGHSMVPELRQSWATTCSSARSSRTTSRDGRDSRSSRSAANPRRRRTFEPLVDSPRSRRDGGVALLRRAAPGLVQRLATAPAAAMTAGRGTAVRYLDTLRRSTLGGPPGLGVDRDLSDGCRAGKVCLKTEPARGVARRARGVSGRGRLSQTGSRSDVASTSAPAPRGRDRRLDGHLLSPAPAPRRRPDAHRLGSSSGRGAPRLRNCLVAPAGGGRHVPEWPASGTVDVPRRVHVESPVRCGGQVARGYPVALQ